VLLKDLKDTRKKMNTPALVIDCGSHTTKAGVSGNNMPFETFRTAVGSVNTATYEKIEASQAVGDVLFNRRNVTRRYPIEHGHVKDWDDLEILYHHIFYEALRMSPADSPLILTESVHTTELEKKKQAEIMIEKFDVPALYFGLAPVLGLYASGRTTGLAVDIGYNFTSVVPVHENEPVIEGVMTTDIGGHDITNYLSIALVNQYFDTMRYKSIIEDIKHNKSFVIDDSNFYARKHWPNDFYELPDGSILPISDDRFHATELLFDTSHFAWGSLASAKGIHHTISDSIIKFNIQLQGQFYHNMVLMGGTVQLPGLSSRLYREISARVSKIEFNRQLHIITDESRYASWIGGSIVGSLSSFDNMVTTKQDYEEIGHNCIQAWSWFAKHIDRVPVPEPSVLSITNERENWLDISFVHKT
jgi:actin-related protein